MLKLVEIKDVREGFVYENNQCKYCVYEITKDGFWAKSFWTHNNRGTRKDMEFYKTLPDDWNLIGKRLLTHKIVGAGQVDELVEIPRRDIEVGDVFCVDGVDNYVITALYQRKNMWDILFDNGVVANNIDGEYGSIDEYIKDDKKVGIYGIHYELINSIEE